MNINVGHLEYEWLADWAQLPPLAGFAHHGMALAADGSIVTGHATDPKILILSPDGELLREVALPVTETTPPARAGSQRG